MAASVAFAVDDGLLAQAGDRLRADGRLRIVLGGAGSGKTSVCGHLAADDAGLVLVDMDARIYGGWGGRWDPRRHPVATAWVGVEDPLAWQLAMDPGAFVAFQAALAAEVLDLLADEVAEVPRDRPTLLVDGGFGSLATVARAVPAEWIACLVAAAARTGAPRCAVWLDDPDRRAFLEVVAATRSVDDPVARFLDLDEALNIAMRTDAEATGVALIERGPGETVGATARRVGESLGIGMPPRT